jgi:hypothetical protein
MTAEQISISISAMPDAHASSVSVSYVSELVSLYAAEALGVGFCRKFSEGLPPDGLAARHFELLAELEHQTGLLLHALIQRHHPAWNFESSFSLRRTAGETHAEELLLKPWKSTIELIVAGGPRYLQRVEKLLAMCPQVDHDAIVAVHRHEQALIEWATRSISGFCPQAVRCLVDAIDAVRDARQEFHEDW